MFLLSERLGRTTAISITRGTIVGQAHPSNENKRLTYVTRAQCNVEHLVLLGSRWNDHGPMHTCPTASDQRTRQLLRLTEATINRRPNHSRRVAALWLRGKNHGQSEFGSRRRRGKQRADTIADFRQWVFRKPQVMAFLFV